MTIMELLVVSRLKVVHSKIVIIHNILMSFQPSMTFFWTQKKF